MRRRPAFWIFLGILVLISGAALLWKSKVQSPKSKVSDQFKVQSSEFKVPEFRSSSVLGSRWRELELRTPNSELLNSELLNS
jgi:hypothetical protein